MPAKPVSATIDRFLEFIFSGAEANAYVCAFPGDPVTAAREHWRGGIYQHWRRTIQDHPAYNSYFCISQFDSDSDGLPHRRRYLHRATYVIVIDDVIAKVKPEAIRLGKPTYILETSPNNQQWGYVLTTPETNADRIDNLLDGLVRNGLTVDGKDPGMKGVTRYVRLPYSTNNKAVYPRPFPVILRQWHPARHRIEDIAAAYGIDLDAARGQSRGAVAVSQTEAREHELVRAFEALGRVSGYRAGGRIDVTCPWVEQHTQRADSGAVLLTGRDPITDRVGVKFKCHHGHCADKWIKDVEDWLRETQPVVYAQCDFADRPDKIGKPDLRGNLLRKQIAQQDLEEIDLRCPLLERETVYVVDKLAPEETVILLGGHGGVGKSYIALTMALCVATGKSFAGLPCRETRVLYYGCEDNRKQLETRLARVARWLGIADTAKELPGRLDVCLGMRANNVLFHTGGITEQYSKLYDRIRRDGVGFVILDTSADMFGGNENDRSEVKNFVNALSFLAADEGRACLLISHVQKTDGRADQHEVARGYSGSTAWHNSVRSRLYLHNDDVSGDIVLELMKSNVGASNWEIPWAWDETCKCFIPQAGRTRVVRATEHEHAVVRAVRDSPTPVWSSPHARVSYRAIISAALASHGRQVAKKHIDVAVQRLTQMGLLQVETVLRDRHPCEILTVTPAGDRFISAANDFDEDLF